MRRTGAGGGDADRNATTGRVVKAALVAGFYPQVVRVQHPETRFVQTAGGTVEKEGEGRKMKYFCRDIGRVFMHPSSVNLQVGKYESPWLVYSERVETARVYVRDNTMVGAYALLLFGGELSVDHERGRLTMDGWAEFNAPARIGVLVREMRGAVDRLLDQHIDKPVGEGEETSLSSSPVVRALLELLATEGF
jgi:ATP-dependent RNA helicase DHX57